MLVGLRPQPLLQPQRSGRMQSDRRPTSSKASARRADYLAHLLVMVRCAVPQAHTQQRHPWPARRAGHRAAVTHCCRNAVSGCQPARLPWSRVMQPGSSNKLAGQQGRQPTCRPGCMLLHCLAAPGTALLRRPPCCGGNETQRQAVGTAAATAAAAAAAGTVVLPAAGGTEVTHAMVRTARRSASIGSQGTFWRREQSPRLTRCLARFTESWKLMASFPTA